MPALLADQARDWSPRVPPMVLKVVVVVALVVAIGASLASEGDAPITAALVESPWYVIGSAIQSAVLVSLALVFVAPTLGTVVAAVGSLSIALIPEINGGVPTVWAAVGSLVAVLALADGVMLSHRRALGRAWLGAATATVVVPEIPEPMRHHLVHAHKGRLAAAAACLLLAIGAIALFVHDSRAATAFRRDSVVASSTVDAVSDDGTSASVTIDGASFRVPLPATVPSVGQTIEVRYQPASHRIEATGDVFDPTLALVPGVGGLLFAATLFGTVWGRRRRMAALLTEGGLAFQVRATWSSRDDGVLLYAYDDVRRALATAPHLTAWLGRPDATVGAEPWLDEDDDEDDGDEYGEYDDDGGHEPARPTASMSDAELLEMAAALASPTDGDADADSQQPGAAWENVPVVVVGLSHDGAPAALRDAQGQWYVSRGEIKPPRGARTSVATAWASCTEALSAVVGQLARRTGRWLPWLVVPVEWWVLTWMFEEVSIIHVISTCVTCAVVGWTWSIYGRARLSIRPRWLRARGRFIDELVAWSRITSVVTDGTSLVIRLDTDNDAEGDALLLGTGPGVYPLTRDLQSLDEVAGRLDLARRERAHALAPRVRWRPAAPALVGACWLATAVIAAVSAR